MKLVFVGGIHGSGKGHFCSLLAPRVRAIHYSAGEIIQEASTRSKRKSKNKAVTSAERNQVILLQSLTAMRSSIDRLLLDGHFCLLGPNQRANPIPIENYSALNPSILVLLNTPIPIVQMRLHERDEVEYSLQTLQALQDCELAHARAVSKAINVPLKTITNNEPLDATAAFINSILDAQ